MKDCMSDFDKELVHEILHQIKSSCGLIIHRTKYITTYDDFTNDDVGLEKMDATAMQLIAIGESIKNLDKVTHRKLLNQYPDFEWKKAMAMRDIISHHYFDLNPEIVFDVCKNEIPRLCVLLDLIITDMENLT